MDEIEVVLKEFEGFILSKDILKNAPQADGTYHYKLILQLKDMSLLAIEERMNKLGYQYSYHWMDSNKTLIIRWDNAPKHLDISLHHKHVGSNQNVQPSEAMNTRKVLAFIAKIIGVFVLIAVSVLAFF